MRPALLGVGAIAIAIAPTVGLAADVYKIDPTHAWVSFAIAQHPWARYLGVFHTIEGRVEFDKSDAAASDVEVEIATGSVDTSNSDRDQGELQTAGFLNGVGYPKITFKSTGIEKTGDRSARITGDLMMAGKTKSVVLDTTFNGEAVSPWDGQMRAGFSATATLDTNDFGLSGIVPLKIGPEVDVTIEVEAVKCGLGCP